jgi:hypothetical protein
MSTDRRQYQGHTIEVVTQPVKGRGFTAHCDIENHSSGNHVEITHFESGHVFATEAEALECGLKMGRTKVNIGFKTKTS